MSNVGVVEKLTSFQHKDANGRDWGLNVRQRAKELAALVTDPDRIRAERQKARSPLARACMLTCLHSSAHFIVRGGHVVDREHSQAHCQYHSGQAL